MSYATPGDVEVELGVPPLRGRNGPMAGWLDRVERRMRRQFVRAGLDLAAQIVLNDPVLADVIDVETAAVVRKIQNPNWGETSTTRSVDDASITSRREGADLDPLMILDDEWSLLLPKTPNRATIYSVLPS